MQPDFGSQKHSVACYCHWYMAVILQMPRNILLKDIQLYIIYNDVGLTQVVLVATVLVGMSEGSI